MSLPKKRSHDDSDLARLEMDDSAYVLYHAFEAEFPCLSFDVLPHTDAAHFLQQPGISHSSVLHSSLSLANYERPLTVHLVVGTQSDIESTPEQDSNSTKPSNSVSLLRLSGLEPIKSSLKQLDRERSGNKEEEEEEEDSSSDSSSSEDEADQRMGTKPKCKRSLRSSCISVPSAVNRLRITTLDSKLVRPDSGEPVLCAVWTERNGVLVYNVRPLLSSVDEPNSNQTSVRDNTCASRGTGDIGGSQCSEQSAPLDSKPLHRYKGHRGEGFAIAWSSTVPGRLASGGNDGAVRVWEPSDACSKWSVSATPAGEHAASVEDVQWSPRDRDTLASVSADRSLRIWDVRVGRGSSGSSTAAPAPALAVADAHRADINVLHWNPLKPEFLLTGGDDGFLRIWDNRLLKSGRWVGEFAQHAGSVCSVEWCAHDESTFASAGADDDRVLLWDLSIEPDPEAAATAHTTATAAAGSHDSDSKSTNTNSNGSASASAAAASSPTLQQQQQPEEKKPKNSAERTARKAKAAGVDGDGEEVPEPKAEPERKKPKKPKASTRLPPQLLFVHEGQKELRELHWHPQLPGVLITTANSGFNIFRTISV